MAVTKAQMRMLQRRRMSDTDRLVQQYRRNVESLTGDYESAFGQFQQKRAAAMAPFEAEFEKYKTETLPAYQQQAEAYRQRLSDFQAQLASINENPLEQMNFPVGTRGNFIVDGQRVGANTLRNQGFIIEGTQVFRQREVPTFTEKAPEAPKVPVAPQVEEFDSSQFEQRKAALETDFKREVGERRAGRMAAVSRRSARPMLQRS